MFAPSLTEYILLYSTNKAHASIYTGMAHKSHSKMRQRYSNVVLTADIKSYLLGRQQLGEYNAKRKYHQKGFQLEISVHCSMLIVYTYIIYHYLMGQSLGDGKCYRIREMAADERKSKMTILCFPIMIRLAMKYLRVCLSMHYNIFNIIIYIYVPV